MSPNPSHDDVSALVDQAFNLELQNRELKQQVFDIADDLTDLYGSYESLQVITAGCTAEAEHVCAVLYGLNFRFQDLIEQLTPIYQRDRSEPAPSAAIGQADQNPIEDDPNDQTDRKNPDMPE